MSATDSLVSKFKAEFSGQAVSMVATGALTVLLARLLSPTDYGVLYLSLSIFALVSLFSTLGIPRSAAKYVAEYRASDPGQVPYIVKRAALYLGVSSGVTAVGFLLTREYIAEYVDEPALGPFLLVGVLFVVGTTVVGFLRNVLQGFEQITRCSFINVCVSVGELVFAVGFVLLGFGAVGALVGYVVAFAIASLLGSVFLYRALEPYETAPEVAEGLYGRILEYNVPIIFTRGSNVVDKQVDTILVGAFLTPVAVGYYVVSKQVVQFVQAPAAALGFTVSPTFGKRKADDDLEGAARTYESTLVYLLLLYLPAAAGIALVAEPMIRFTFGTDYLGAVPVLQILSAFVVLQALMQVTSNALDFLGRARTRAIAKGVTAVANAGLNVLLIPRLGVEGAAIATVITYSLYAALNLYVISTEFPLRTGYVVRRTTTIVGITGVMSLLVFSLLEYVGDPLTLAGIVALGVLTWFVLSAVTGLIELDELSAVLGRSSG